MVSTPPLDEKVLIVGVKTLTVNSTHAHTRVRTHTHTRAYIRGPEKPNGKYRTLKVRYSFDPVLSNPVSIRVIRLESHLKEGCSLLPGSPSLRLGRTGVDEPYLEDVVPRPHSYSLGSSKGKVWLWYRVLVLDTPLPQRIEPV